MATIEQEEGKEKSSTKQFANSENHNKQNKGLKLQDSHQHSENHSNQGEIPQHIEKLAKSNIDQQSHTVKNTGKFLKEINK